MKTLFFAFCCCLPLGIMAQNAAKPKPQNDTLVLEVAEGQLHNILMNDYVSRDNNPTSFTITAPPKGKAEVRPDKGVGKLFYVPTADLEDDVLTYQICNDGECAEAKVLIVKCIPGKSAYANVEDVLLRPDESKTYSYAQQVIKPSRMPEKCKVTFSADSSQVTFTPEKGYTGEDRFNFDVYSRKKQCGYTYQQGVNAFIQALPKDEDNKAPIAATDEVTIIGMKATEIAVFDNDSDPEGNLRKKIQKLSKAANGKVKYTPKVVTYTPKQDFYGTETLTYEVCDYSGACSQGKIVIKVKKK
ncbi:MAG TPA: Ig-like domain-containing protein [Chitinophagales bacterium]|jgi:hypothetical protein|nr:Ig-like domain-containing protein [Chitinophagales bacterium]